MKKHFLIYINLLLVLTGFFYSCKENSFEPDEYQTGIYFQNDSIRYSFGVTPFEITTYDLLVPVKIMGAPVAVDRKFKVKIIDSLTNAVEGTHYTIAQDLVIPKDSINSTIILKLNRNSMAEEQFRVVFELVSNEDFIPVNEGFRSSKVYFNNILDKPNWKNFQGAFSYPTSKLGVWQPAVYVKYIELFRNLKNIVPRTYERMVELYGEDLANPPLGGWPSAYDFTLSKYVLIPLYQYFMEEHPELGNVVPRPSIY